MEHPSNNSNGNMDWPTNSNIFTGSIFVLSQSVVAIVHRDTLERPTAVCFNTVAKMHLESETVNASLYSRITSTKHVMDQNLCIRFKLQENKLQRTVFPSFSCSFIFLCLRAFASLSCWPPLLVCKQYRMQNQINYEDMSTHLFLFLHFTIDCYRNGSLHRLFLDSFLRCLGF